MGLFSRTPEQQAAARRYTAAMDELERVSKRDRAESDAYHDANDAVAEAMEDPDLSAWARWWG